MKKRTALTHTWILWIVVAGWLIACTNEVDMNNVKNNGRAASIDGTTTETLRLKRFDIIDHASFGQPVVVASFLAPADWTMESSVQWNNAQTPCALDLVSIHVRVQDAQGLRSFEIFPLYVGVWADDPMMRQALGFNHCRITPPLSSVDFIQQAFIPGFRPGAAMLETRPRPQAAQAMREKIFAREGNTIAQSGARVSNDAVQARIAYHTGSGSTEEWVVATASTTTIRSPYGNHVNAVDDVLSFKAPAGELARNEQLFNLIVNSYAKNPAYEAALRNVARGVAQAQHEGRMAQIDQIRRANQQFFQQQQRAINQRSRELRQQSNESTQRGTDRDWYNQRVAEVIRDTESRQDPFDSDTSWEMPIGYDHVWKTSNDEFVFTNDINYDPNIEFYNNDWQRMVRP